VPRRVLAPQRGALVKSPGGLPFLSHPRRSLVDGFGFSITLRLHAFLLCRAYRAEDGLAARVYVNVFDGHFLLRALTLQLPHRACLIDVKRVQRVALSI